MSVRRAETRMPTLLRLGEANRHLFGPFCVGQMRKREILSGVTPVGFLPFFAYVKNAIFASPQQTSQKSQALSLS